MASQYKIDTSKTVGYIKDFSKKQLPFAAAGALNDLAFKAREAVIKAMPSIFILRTPFLTKGIVVNKATKKDLKAEVMSRDSLLYKQEYGGELKASEHRIAIPRQVRTNIRQKVPRSKFPGPMLQKKGVFEGKWSIFQVMRGQATKILYALVDRVRIKPRFGMGDIVKKTIKAEAPGAFIKSIDHAERTAKR